MRNRNSKNNGSEIDPTGWMVTFSDMVMLLLTFFVMLLTMSSMEIGDLRPVLWIFSAVDEDTVESRDRVKIKGGTGVMSKGGGGAMEHFDSERVNVMADRIGKILIEQKSLRVTSRETQGDIFALADVDHDEKLKDLESIIDISEDERGVIITFGESVLFNPGEAGINPTMFPILDSIAKVLGAVSNEVLIMGHTDNVPIHGGRYGSNWDLSLYRALNVHSYFVENKGLSPKRCAVGGYGDIRPLSPNNTKEARKKNRRVEIILKREKSID